MRHFWPVFLFIAGTVALATFWNNSGSIRKMVNERLESGDFLTFEVRHSAGQILEKQRKVLTAGYGRTILEPTLAFLPCLMIDVKYPRPDHTTAEGSMLWSLVDGEMITDTETWELSHGFEDCINANATQDDYQLIHLLLAHGGKMDRTAFLKELQVDESIADTVLESACKKLLLVREGSIYRLHFQDPLLPPLPETHIYGQLVTKSYKHNARIKARYTEKQIVEHAQAAYGSQVAMRRIKEVFLPVHIIEVENPDGSILTTHWNGLNGQKLLRTF